MKLLNSVNTRLNDTGKYHTRRTEIDDICLYEYVSKTSDYASTTVYLHDVDADSIRIDDVELESGRMLKVLRCLTINGEYRDINLYLAD